MNFRKSFPYVNFYLFGGFFILALGVSVYTYIVSDSFAAMFAATLCTLGFFAVFGLQIIAWYTSIPNFVTDHGVAVWTNGIANVTPEKITKLLDFYIDELPDVLTDLGLESKFPIETFQLEGMLVSTTLDIRKRIDVLGIGWSAKDKAGLQRGPHVMVQHVDQLHESALFHEYHHMIDELHFNITPDVTHSRKDWWATVAEVKKRYSEYAKRNGELV
jgi:hypothetical protein